MFHRRLCLLVLLSVVGVMVLLGQLARLAVAEHAMHLEAAEAVLATRRLIPTVRGRILDRKGRVIAEDVPCYDVQVDYEVITGQWAYQQARRDAYRAHRKAWREMDESEKYELIKKYLAPYEYQQELLWQTICRVCRIERSDLERRKWTIKRRVQTVRASVWDRLTRRREQELNRTVEPDEVDVTLREEVAAHTLLAAVPDETAMRLQLEGADLPGLHVKESKTRRYLQARQTVDLSCSTLPGPIRSDQTVQITVDGVATHIVGTMRNAWAADVKARPFRDQGTIDLGGYLPGDTVGRSGVEKAMEDHLRGRRGQKVLRRDIQQVHYLPPEPGADVQLTIDMQLQARIQAIMSPQFGLMQRQSWHANDQLPEGTPLYGAAVVIEVDSGDLLALVSSPTFSREQLQREGGRLANDSSRPMVNRPISAIYPPASTMKPLVYAIATEQGVIAPEEKIECRGHLYPNNPGAYRCWGWRPERGLFIQHGPLDGGEGIKHSCNIFFYTCGMRLGARKLVEAYHRWGIGVSQAIGLEGAAAGILPKLHEKNLRGRELSRSNAIFMAIGQGPIAITPLQVANAHAALARGGKYQSAVLIEQLRDQVERRDLHLKPGVFKIAMRGMFDAVNAHDGTGNHIPGGESIFNVGNMVIRGKTGTAQAPVQFDDLNGNQRMDEGEPILRSGNHGWFVAHVSETEDGPVKYVVCVVVEYGGSGGRSAGPVVNQILHAMQAEGYLPLTPREPGS